MPATQPEPYFASDDYETIEAAVLETARGRWFLAEHARRERAAERAQLMFSVQRLERVAHENLQTLRLQQVAEDLAQKLDEVLRSLPAREPAIPAEERRLIEQRLIEPRPFLQS